VIPLVDLNPTRRVPWVTLTIIVVCVVVYFGFQPVGRRNVFDVGLTATDLRELEYSLGRAAIPCELTRGRPLTRDEVRLTFGERGDTSACGKGATGSPPYVPGKDIWLSAVVSMFLHGSIAHLAGNLLFLWVFGNNIEDRKGSARFALFYLASGLVAMVAYVLVFPDSTVPVVGASGAIAGVMGAYLAWFPTARVKSLVVLTVFVSFRKVSAAWLLGAFVLEQLLLVRGPSQIAWAAHLGGFGFGVVVGLLWRRTDRRRTLALRPADVAA
jgi:membrane associated rhomboid family serine protease